MAIAIVGDIHGDVKAFREIVDRLKANPDIVAIIQVGDFGWYQNLLLKWELQQWDIPVYWIHGNHEEFPLLRGIEEVTEMKPNLFYVPNGTVLEIDGRKIAFVGGAASVDKMIQMAYGSWYDDENIKDEDIRKLDDVDSVDLLITHVPPQSVIQNGIDPVTFKRAFDPRDLVKYFGLPITWRDPNADKIEALWERLGYPQIYCGHMHKRVLHNQCRILNINEVVVV